MNSIYDAHYPKWKLIAGVEQSMSGYNIITAQPMNFPIVDVATSKWKRTHEASFIARDCVNILLNRLKYKYKEDIYKLNYLIVGVGAIGSNILKLLEHFIGENMVQGYDIDTDKNYTAIPDLDKVDVLIGATGNHRNGENSENIARTILDEIDEGVKRNLYLASVSTFDIEFGQLTHETRKSEKENSECTKDYTHQNAVLLKSGFPINFPEGSSENDIQLTRSLVFCGIIQSLEEDIHGMNDLFATQLLSGT